MKQTFKLSVIVIALFAGIVGASIVPSSAQAIDVFSGSCGGSAGGANAPAAPAPAAGGSSSSLCGATTQDSAPDIIKNVINLLLYLVGIIAVIVIIINGIRYTTSNGDASGVKSAKDGVLYAVVGLVVAILAYAIVNFVVEAF